MDSRDRARPAGAPAPAAAVARTRQRVLDALRARPDGTTIAELAGRLGLHPNTVRFHVDRLLTAEQAERLPSPPRGPGRPAALVRATPGAAPRHYRLLAETLSLALAATPEGTRIAEHAGRELGRRLAAEAGERAARAETPILLEVLRGLDFAPAQTRPDEIELHSCPFLEVADGPGSAACALHLGLMHGALEALDTGDELESLTPFAGPTHCVARLRTAA